MKRTPIENKGEFIIINGAENNYVYAIPKSRDPILIENNSDNDNEKITSNQQKEDFRIYNIFFDSFQDRIIFGQKYDDSDETVYVNLAELINNNDKRVLVYKDGDVIVENYMKYDDVIYDSYIVCYSCEAIKQQIEYNKPITPFATNGWNYVTTTENLSFKNYADEKISFIKKLGFEELSESTWCRECGSFITSKTHMKEYDDYIELSYSFRKNEEISNKLKFKLPSNVKIKDNKTITGKVFVYNEFTTLTESNIVFLHTNKYNIITTSNDIIGTLTTNNEEDEIHLTINDNVIDRQLNLTFSIYINKNVFINLQNINKYHVLQVAKYNNDNFLHKYIGYVKMFEYNEQNIDDDTNYNWPIENDIIIDPGDGDDNKIGVRNIIAWGLNNYGQLGDGTTVNKTVEFNNNGNIYVEAQTTNSILTDAIKVRAGRDHTIGIKNDKTVWTWGRNNIGQLGLSYRDESVHSFPTKINDLSGIKDVSAGWFHSVALDSNGMVWTWGGNYKGQLGNGTNSSRSRPAQVKVNQTEFLDRIVSIDAGAEHTIALDEDGNVWEWGEDIFYPRLVNGLSNIVKIAAGSWHSIALKNDGTVWSWGYNWSGQLGIGFEEHPDKINEKGEFITAVQVLGLTDIIDIDCGSEHSLALRNDGTLWSWGNNDKGQLGIGTIKINKYYPVQVQNISDVDFFATGEYFNFASTNNGTVFAWGDNLNGQLLLNDKEIRKSPVVIPLLKDIRYLSCGLNHSLAIKK
jgi:Alpha-tubulin suppressor and related RCC1 domain-containing proteins